MDKKSIFSYRITNLRKEKGLTQAEVAEGIGVSRQSITLYESGSRLPDIEILTNIARFFEVSSDYLLGLSDIHVNTGGQEMEKSLGLSSNAITNLMYLASQKNRLNNIFTETEYERVKWRLDATTTLYFIDRFLDKNVSYLTRLGEYINRRYTDIVHLTSSKNKNMKDVLKSASERNWVTYGFKLYLENEFNGCFQDCLEMCASTFPASIYDNHPKNYKMSCIHMAYAEGYRIRENSDTDDTEDFLKLFEEEE